MSTLATDVRLLADLIHSIDQAIQAGGWDTVDEGLTCWAVLEDANRQLATLRSDFAAVLADELPTKAHTVMGVGTFEAHRKTDRKSWDTDELRRIVLDTKLVDTETGEVADETPTDKLLHVFPLGPPRVTALRARGLDPDEFCETTRGALTLRLVTS